MINPNKFTYFVPVRRGSERISGKSTRKFSHFEGGLLELKLHDLLATKVEKIVVSTDDEKAIEISNSFKDGRIIIDERPKYLCSSETPVQDLVDYIPTIVENLHIFWVHVTAPLVGPEIYNTAIDVYSTALETGYDSVMSVTRFQQFLWDTKINNVINFDRTKILWPRTQDLEPLYEINHAFYISSRNNYLKLRDRIGVKPFMFEITKREACDVDWQDDFEIAELMFDRFRGQRLN